jgi:hypothetical protein
MVDMLLVVLVFSSVVSVGLLFLPALIEFKKPQDSGPRLIPDFMFPTPITTELEEEEDKPQELLK